MAAKSDFYSEIASNKRRTLLLMFVFSLVVLVLGYALGAYWGSPAAGLVMAFVISLAMAWSSYYWSDRFVLALYHARPAEKDQFPQLVNVVEGLSIAAGLPMPAVYVIDDPSPNAFATGRNPEHSVICVTTGLLQAMDRYELEGVIAHEMSHIRNYDILVATVAVVLAGVVVLLGNWLTRSLFFGGRRRSSSSRGGNPIMLVLMLVGVLFALLSPLVAQLMRMAVSRRREYLADASSVQLTRYPEGLASALAKLSALHAPMRDADNATAHLFIVNPLGGKSLSSLFSTHPPIEDRIARLHAMDMGEIRPDAPR